MNTDQVRLYTVAFLKCVLVFVMWPRGEGYNAALNIPTNLMIALLGWIALTVLDDVWYSASQSDEEPKP